MTGTDHLMNPPSPWVQRFAKRIRQGGEVLDLACGGGRHARWLAGEGWKIEAVDRDSAALAGLAGVEAYRHFGYLANPTVPILAALTSVVFVTVTRHRASVVSGAIQIQESSQ